MYELWYDYVNSGYRKKAEHQYMDINSLIVHAKVETIYEDLAGGIEKGFNTSNYRFEKSLPIRPNKKLIWLIKGRWIDKVTTYLADYAL